MEWELLADLDDDERRAVLARATRRRYRKGDTLFHEGDPGDTLHLLAKGRTAVRVSTPLGELATLTVLGPGATFGELALVFPDSRRTATVVALEPVETLTIAARDFDELCRQHPAVQRTLIVALAGDVRRLSTQMLDALYLPADRRVLRRLATLTHLYADHPESISIPLTQEDVATMAGTTRPTVNRILQGLTEAGIVTLARGRITITDPEELARRAR